MFKRTTLTIFLGKTISIIAISVLFLGSIFTEKGSAYAYRGYHWIIDSPTWPNYRVAINYSSLPENWKTSIYKARMEWNNSGRSNLYFYYSKTSDNTVTKGHYGNTAWLALTRVRTIGPFITEVDTVINEDVLWNTKGIPSIWEHDLQSVATHELGHWLSLDHSRNPYSTMYSTNRNGSWKTRTLSSDDIAGIQHIYGNKGSLD